MGSTNPDDGIPPNIKAIIGTTSVPKPFTPVLAMPIIMAESMANSHIENVKSIYSIFIEDY
jgi:predicted urease superfamily metal-dependent hydrolase